MIERPLASFLTALSMALGVAAVIVVLVIHRVAVDQFNQDAQGYNFIVGGTGGRTQLVLSTVYHLDKPLYPISYAYYRKFVDGKYEPFTDVAVPYCLGDSLVLGDYKYRVVGTTPELFDKLKYDGESSYAFAEGENFRREDFFTGVVGSVVAKQGGLKVGDTFNPTHGLGAEGKQHDEFTFTVVGVLEPTGTANDRAVYVNMEGFYLLDGHALSEKTSNQTALERLISMVELLLSKVRNTSDDTAPSETRDPGVPEFGFDGTGTKVEPLEEYRREVTSILVRASDPMSGIALMEAINKGDSGAQAVAPAAVVTQLLENIIGPVQVVLLVLTGIIVLVASIGILVSIYNSMSERAHDIAVMRALGASRSAVQIIVLLEAVLLAVLGGLAGIVFGHLLVGLVSPAVEQRTGVTLHMLAFDPWEILVIPGIVMLAIISGILPALTAYRTDVAKALSGTR